MKQWQTLFSWAPKSLQMVNAAMDLKDTPWKKSYDLDSILKNRDITLLTKVCLVKSVVFPIVMCGCESWTIKKAEHWRINWCFWTVVLEKTLENPLDSKEFQSILKEIWPEYSLEGLMLNLKLQYFGHWSEELTHLKKPWCWERLKAGGEGDDRGWDGWVASPILWT